MGRLTAEAMNAPPLIGHRGRPVRWDEPGRASRHPAGSPPRCHHRGRFGLGANREGRRASCL